MLGSTPDSRCITAVVMSSTPGGGLLRDFASWKSFLFRVFNAVSACWTRGMALARSSSHEAYVRHKDSESDKEREEDVDRQTERERQGEDRKTERGDRDRLRHTYRERKTLVPVSLEKEKGG